MNWFSKIHELAGQEYERYLPTAFDGSLTLLEKVNKVIETLNQIVLGVNTVAEYVDGHVDTQNEKIKQLRDDFEVLKDWLENEGLEERTKQVLNEWFDNGRLAQIINNDVFDMKADKATFEQFVLSTSTQLQQIHYNVKKYGAKGDGITNDTFAIQSVIDLVSTNIANGTSTQNTIYFPPGVYLVDHLVIKRPIALVGNYTNLYKASYSHKKITGTTIKSSGAYYDFLIDYNSNVVSEQNADTQQGTQIRDISFDGNNSEQSCLNMVFTGWEAIIQNVTISNFLKHAIKADTAYDTNVYGLTIQNCGSRIDATNYYCIEMGGQQGTTNAWHFHGLHIEFTYYALKISKAEDIVFTNSKFEVNVGDYPTFLIDGSISNRLTFNACSFMIGFIGEAYMTEVSNGVRVLGNVIYSATHFTRKPDSVSVNTHFMRSYRPVTLSTCSFTKLRGLDSIRLVDSIFDGNYVAFDNNASPLYTTGSTVVNNHIDVAIETVTGTVFNGTRNKYANNELKNVTNMVIYGNVDNSLIRDNTRSIRLINNKSLVINQSVNVDELPLFNYDEVNLYNDTLTPLYVLAGGRKYWFNSGKMLTLKKNGTSYTINNTGLNIGATTYSAPINFDDIPTDVLKITVQPDITNVYNNASITLYNDTAGTLTVFGHNLPTESFMTFRYFNSQWRTVQ